MTKLNHSHLSLVPLVKQCCAGDRQHIGQAHHTVTATRRIQIALIDLLRCQRDNIQYMALGEQYVSGIDRPVKVDISIRRCCHCCELKSMFVTVCRGDPSDDLTAGVDIP